MNTVGKKRLVLSLCVFLFCWTLTTHRKYSGDGDEPHYMMIAYSLLFDGDLELSNNYGKKDILISDGTLPLMEGHIRRGRGERFYPIHDVGMPILFSPAFGVSYLISFHIEKMVPSSLLKRFRLDQWGVLKGLMGIVMILVTCLLVVQLFELFRFIANNQKLAFWSALLVGISPPVLSFSYLFFTEILSALIAVHIFVKMEADQQQTFSKSMWIGLLAGFLILVHIRNIGIAIPLFLFGLFDRWKGDRRVFWAYVGSFAAVVLFRTTLNFYMWESLVINVHAKPDLSLSFFPMIRETAIRLFGLFFDREHGLLVFAPLYCLVGYGLFQMRKKNSHAIDRAIVILACYIGTIACPLINTHGWSGGWSPAARFLVPVIPFLSLGVLGTFHSGNFRRLPIRMIIAVQIVLNIFLWQSPKLLWSNGDGHSSFVRELFFGSAILENLVPSWHRPTFSSVVITIVATAGIFLLSWFLSTSRRPPAAMAKED